MAAKEEQALRDFVHTVDMLTASALAEHERARAAQPTMPARLVRRPYAAVAAALGLVMAIGLPAYLTMPPMEHRYPTANSRPPAESAARPVQRQAALESETRQREAADARQRQIEIAEARRRKELADATEAEARRKAEATAEAKRSEVQRIASLEEARRKEDETRRQAETAAEAKRMEEARIAALEESRRIDEKRKEDERLRLAGIPDDEQRAEFVRKVQLVLKQNRCYDGALNGRSDEAQEGVKKLVENANKRGQTKPPRIELARATIGDFEAWLKDVDAIKGGLCTPAVRAAADTKARRKPPEAMARRQYTAPRQPSYQGGGSGGGGGTTVIQGIR